MDYPSNLPAFSREGLLGLLQGLDRFQILPTDELRGVRQGLLSNDPRGTATNLGLLGISTVVPPVAKLAKSAYKALLKGDHIKVPYLNNPSKKLVQHEVGFGTHQIAPEDGRFTLVGPTRVIKSSKGDAKVGYQVLDGVGGKKIGEVELLRGGSSGRVSGKRGTVGTTEDINAIVNIEIAPKHRKKGIATDILDSLRASTEGKPLGINDIQNIKFFTKYRDALGQIGKTKSW